MKRPKKNPLGQKEHSEGDARVKLLELAQLTYDIYQLKIKDTNNKGQNHAITNKQE